MKNFNKNNTLIAIFKDDDIKKVVNTIDRGLKCFLKTPFKKK